VTGLKSPDGEAAPRLHPADAVAAVILVPGRGYLLQRRDDRPDIFFPGHWGLFGGAIEPGESEEAALIRELAEEIGLALAPDAARYFTRVDFDWNRPGCGRTTRAFFEVILAAETVALLTLHEGAEMRVIPPEAIETLAPVTPYDAFALWLHINRERISWSIPERERRRSRRSHGEAVRL
jgi:8-oxo-dGTP pyrophosphatase MutT (NUDIX family)